MATPLDTYQAALATFGTSPTPQNASAVVAARLACMTTVAGDRSSMTLPELPAYIQRLAAAYRPGDVRVALGRPGYGDDRDGHGNHGWHGDR